MNRTTETVGDATGQTGWRKTYARNWTPPAQPCGAWGKKMKPDVQAQALQAFGADRQVDKCIEELGELATALVKYRHGETDAAAVIDELVDVAVTTGTLWLLFDKCAIEARIAVKLARLQKLVADQVQATAKPETKPEPKPVRPALCWSKWQDGYLLLDGTNWRGYVGHLNGRWAADTGTNDRQWFADSASAMREIERRNGLDEVPLWT